MPSRRALLGACGIAAVAGLAGCESVPDNGGERLGEIGIENVDDQPHTVHALIEFDGELVHWSATDVAAAEMVGESGTDPARASEASIERTWPDDPGRFVIRVRLDDRSSWRSLDSGDLDGTCYDVKVDVTDWDDDGEPHTELIPEPRDCESFV